MLTAACYFVPKIIGKPSFPAQTRSAGIWVEDRGTATVVITPAARMPDIAVERDVMFPCRVLHAAPRHMKKTTMVIIIDKLNIMRIRLVSE
jgi:hypothetical protein